MTRLETARKNLKVAKAELKIRQTRLNRAIRACERVEKYIKAMEKKIEIYMA